MKIIKKITLLLLLGVDFTFSLEFYVNSGREDSRDFAVLNIVDSEPFSCKEKLNRESEVEEIVCEFESNLISHFSKTNTLFFSINPEITKERFYLRITPKHKIRLFNVGQDLLSSKPIFQEKAQKSSKWQIIGYGGEIPFLEEEENEGLNFPISFNGDSSYPRVGVLDFGMRPMDNEVGQDKDTFLAIQNLLKNKSYQEALARINEMLQIYPETIFKHDVLFMKLKALEGIGGEENYEEIVSLGKAWLSAYPADIHIPEVLLLLAENYAKMNFFEEASYYYDRIFKEYKNDKSELLARLSYGQKVFERGDRKMPLELYQSVLDQTQDLEVASLAALLLGEYYQEVGDKKRAEEYLKKVLDANPNYFLNDIPKHYAILQKWADLGIYETPAEVAEVMFLSLSDDALPYYRPLLRDMAEWYDKAGNVSKAHQYYQLLLKKPKDIQEEREIQALDDSLLLNDKESNATKRLEHYDYVIKTYKGKAEEQEALLKKAQTLYEIGNYQAVFEMRDLLPKDDSVLLQSVGVLTQESIAKRDCKNTAYYGNLYAQKIPLDSSGKIDLFDCLYENQQFEPALKIAQEESSNAKNSEAKEKWLYRLGWVEYHMQNYPKAILASRDVVEISKNPNHKDSLWVLFMALDKEKRKEEAFKLLPKMEESLGADSRMIEVYRIMLLDALGRKDDTAIRIYANKLMDLQEQHKKYEYSPWVELSLVEALNREGKFKESLEVLQKSQAHIATPNDKIRILYLQGYLSDKLNQKAEAISFYGQCEAINVQSNWRNLCIEAKKLLEAENTTKENK
ncbi:flagellar functional protein [Helicobacter sp.]|uniref:tetratricopeptide repeat protein n=1 Tax=Helicobacter sp. TaxID=218 RepID=UPI00258E4FFF|nr:flagellar functional protein [Helicobacter sp.]MCI7047036.1 flagellar functional protein [Helicobacter sp.]